MNLYENDGQIVELHVYMGDDKHNPGVTVQVKEIVGSMKGTSNVEIADS